MALLLVHSHWSLVTGPCSPKTLAEEAARLGHDHLALVDTNALYGLLPFARECRRMGLQPLFGTELVAEGMRLFALAEDRDGYRSLCRLVTARSLDAGFVLPLAAAEHARGLHFVCGDLRLLLELHGRVPAEALSVALPPRAHTRSNASRALDEDLPARPDTPRKCPAPLCWPAPHDLHDAARVLGLPCIAVWEAYFARAEDFVAHCAFVAVKRNRQFRVELGRQPGPEQQPGPKQPAPLDPELALPAQHLPAAGQLAQEFADRPDAVARARALRERCTLTFAEQCPPIFPPFTLPDVALADSALPAPYLKALAERGLAQRMPAAADAARARLAQELAVIEQMGFAPYFLVVHEIKELARKRGIPCVGRGSAADSLVSYALGLTEADPLRYRLLFERFLNPGRSDLPDIDLDFCWRRRDELLLAVYERFGHDRVAMIATYATLGPRGAYREAAKALGVPPREVDQRCKQIPGWHHGDRKVSEAVMALPGFVARLGGSHGGDPEHEQRVLALADLLQEAPTHLGIHVGGVVITPGPIADHAPLERAAKGLVITQYDMRACEQLGLVKIDLLGNRALTILQDAQALVRARGREPADLYRIAEDDPMTAQAVRAGRTLGCFQIESPAMRTLLRQLRAADTERVIQAVALVRPGPSASGMKDEFVRRVRGEKRQLESHPLLERAFADTFGIMLYQEDVIRAAMVVAGLSAADGDTLRRTLGKLQHDPRGGREALDRFVVAGLRQGHERALVHEAWDAMARFAGFSFCKAHAVTYGTIAWRCAWMKVHEPACFLAAVLSNDAGFYAKGVYVEEAKRLGVPFLAPCLVHGERAYTVEDRGPGDRRDAIRVGLMEIKELGDAVIDGLLAERARGGRFSDLRDLIARAGLSSAAIERLILAGALDAFGRTRPELMLELRLRERAAISSAEGAGLAAGLATASLFGPLPAPGDDLVVPRLPEYGKERRIELELETLGFSLDEHPVDALFAQGRPKHAILLGQIEERLGKPVVAHGWVVALRRLTTHEGLPMLFFTLEDGSGIVEVAVFPDRYHELAPVLQGRGPYVVEGRLEDQQGGVSLRAWSIVGK